MKKSVAQNAMDIFVNRRNEYDSFNLNKVVDLLMDRAVGQGFKEITPKFLNELCCPINGELSILIELIEHMPERNRSKLIAFMELSENEDFNTFGTIDTYGFNVLNLPDDIEGDIKDCSWMSSDLLYT